MSFEFATATRVIFGNGVLAEVPEIVRGLGVRRILLVTGRTPERAERLRGALRAADLDLVELAVPGEPTVELAQAAWRPPDPKAARGWWRSAAAARSTPARPWPRWCTNGGDPRDYLEVIGRGRALERPSLPLVAIPTTAGHRLRGHPQRRAAVAATSGSRSACAARTCCPGPPSSIPICSRARRPRCWWPAASTPCRS